MKADHRDANAPGANGGAADDYLHARGVFSATIIPPSDREANPPPQRREPPPPQGPPPEMRHWNYPMWLAWRKCYLLAQMAHAELFVKRAGEA